MTDRPSLPCRKVEWRAVDSLVGLVALFVSLLVGLYTPTTGAAAATPARDVSVIAGAEHRTDDPTRAPSAPPGEHPSIQWSAAPATRMTPGAQGVATNNGSSPNQMNKEIQRGQAPNGIERVDRADPNIPGNQDHVHFSGQRATLNRDGTWGHGDGELELTKKQREWLQGHGWCV